jgi:hypothetical protein
VEWLATTYHTHQKRLIGAVRGSYQSQLYLDRVKERHEAWRLPEFIADLVAPKALDRLPSLQGFWDEAHTLYKESLYMALVRAREEKLATQYSPAIREEIIKSLVADVKKLCADKSAADPAHQPTFEAEGKAVFSLFTNSINAWEQQAKDQALNLFNKQQEKKDTTERQTLDQANVSDTNLRANTDTNPLLDPAYWPTTRPQVPPLSTEGHLPNQRQRQGQFCRESQRQQQGQLQRGQQRQRSSSKGQRNVNNTSTNNSNTEHTSTNTPTIVYTKPKSKNRRLSKA